MNMYTYAYTYINKTTDETPTAYEFTRPTQRNSATTMPSTMMLAKAVFDTSNESTRHENYQSLEIHLRHDASIFGCSFPFHHI